jgi:lysophospholipase L1-like esterase
VLRRLYEIVSDRWFGLLIWFRYDVSWRAAVPLLVLSVAVVGSAGVVFSPFDAGTSESPVVEGPVRLPGEVPLPERVFPVRVPVTEVLVVGDSLVAGEEALYREALASVGVVAFFDAAVSRGLRYGWLCPTGVDTPVSEPSQDESTDPDGLEEPDASEEPEDAATDGDGTLDDGTLDDVGEDGLSETSDAAASTETRRSGCVRQGLESVKWYASVGALPQVVVVALGTNDASAPAGQVRARLDDLRTLLEGRRVVLLETATYPMTGFHAGWNETARSWCLEDVSCRFVDWARGAGSPEFFAPDGLHLSASGSLVRAEALASLLAVGY